MNYLFIGLCAAAFAFQLYLGDGVDTLTEALGFVPARLSEALNGEGRLEWVLFSLVSSSFIHAGWFHIVGNLLYLRVFGDNIEERFGHIGFFVFYLLASMAGGLSVWALDPENPVPMVGASGAIAGILGAYIIMFPRARILTVFPIFVVLTFIEVPAFVFLGIWALQQFLNGYLVVADNVQQASGGIAWFAHIGGFCFGVVCGFIGRVVHRRRRRRQAQVD